LKLFVAIYNDARLLEHFLRHYTSVGVSQFFIAVSPQCRASVENAIADYPVTLFHNLDVSDIADTFGVSQMRRAHQLPDEWVVIVDLDEFVECADVVAVAEAADRAGANVVRGIMYDRFSARGDLPAFLPDSQLTDVYPIKSRFIRDVMKGCDHKGVLVKGHLQGATGAIHHWFQAERVFSHVLEISHYKWTDGSIERLRQTHRDLQRAGVWWAVEQERALHHFETHGRFAWETFGGRFSHDFIPDPPAGWCADCGGAMSEAERDYSTRTFGKTLCRTHQAKPRLAARG
jgi:glycosyl transferase family 2